MRSIKAKRKGLTVFFDEGLKEETHVLNGYRIIEKWTTDQGDSVLINTYHTNTIHTKNCLNDFLYWYNLKIRQIKGVWLVCKFDKDLNKTTPLWVLSNNNHTHIKITFKPGFSFGLEFKKGTLWAVNNHNQY